MEKKITHVFTFSLIILIIVLMMLSGCLVPTNEHLMELNRNGKWGEAEKLGQSMLDHRDTFTHAEVCETYFHVIYAKTRLGKNKEAIKMMGSYDKESQKKPLPMPVYWLHREIAKLKEELGVLTPLQKTLIKAMEENGAGNYQQAIELCGEVLASSEDAEIPKTVAHLITAICYIKLKNVEKAEVHMEMFEKMKAILPPGHVALQDAEHARDGLADLKKK